MSTTTTPAHNLTPPRGLAAIVATFGDPAKYLLDDGRISPTWESEHLITVPLPFPIQLSGGPVGVVCKRITCHRLLADIYPALFVAIQRAGLTPRVHTFAGCYNFRAKRTSHHFSCHTWGIAHDINPETNAQGTRGDMPIVLTEIHAQHGFTWGGGFSGLSRDPMHFQFASGY